MAVTKILVSLEDETLAAEAEAFTQEEIDRADEILDELGVRPVAW